MGYMTSYPDVDESDEILLGSTNMSSTDLADFGRRDPSSRWLLPSCCKVCLEWGACGG